MGEGIVLTWDVIIKAGAVLGALTAIVMLFVKLVRWVDRQKAQAKDVEELKKHHDEDMDELKKHHEDDVAALRAAERKQMQELREEQQMLTYGILACLKGLQEKGCNGPVTEAINRFEKYLNAKAHE